MRKLFLFLLMICLLGEGLVAQEKFTFNGYIKDSLTGETLIGANLNIRSEGKGIVSNQYGFFSITLKKSSYLITCSFIGYQTKEVIVRLADNIQQNILLLPNT
ncbi:MAG: carboxypeptidase-like regulatory domain-containing protein, partial [Sediminibacterium sp.]